MAAAFTRDGWHFSYIELHDSDRVDSDAIFNGASRVNRAYHIFLVGTYGRGGIRIDDAILSLSEIESAAPGSNVAMRNDQCGCPLV